MIFLDYFMIVIVELKVVFSTVMTCVSAAATCLSVIQSASREQVKLQTWQDKMRHLLEQDIYLNKPVGLNVRSVLKNLENPQFNGH